MNSTRPSSSADSLEATEQDGLWPVIANVYHEQGYEAGYSRGVSETLALALEATEEFLRSSEHTDRDARSLLYAFSRFVEDRVRSSPGANDHHAFIDGLGI
jgi:hypothetical protein